MKTNLINLATIKLAKSFISLTLLATAMPAIATDGTNGGGGGGAFVCRNADGSIRDAELVDLWEGTNLNDLVIPRTNESVDIQVHRAIQRLSSINMEFGTQVLAQLNHVETHIYYLPRGISLPPPRDVSNDYQKENCPLSGMMYYDDARDRLNIMVNVFDRLISNTDRAAAKLHEALYRYGRSLRDPYCGGARNCVHTNSIPTRALVACLFATNFDRCMVNPGPETTIPTEGDLFRCEGSTNPSSSEPTHEFIFQVGPDRNIDGKRRRYSYKMIWTKQSGAPVRPSSWAEGEVRLVTAAWNNMTERSFTAQPNWVPAAIAPFTTRISRSYFPDIIQNGEFGYFDGHFINGHHVSREEMINFVLSGRMSFIHETYGSRYFANRRVIRVNCRRAN